MVISETTNLTFLVSSRNTWAWLLMLWSKAWKMISAYVSLLCIDRLGVEVKRVEGEGRVTRTEPDWVWQLDKRISPVLHFFLLSLISPYCTCCVNLIFRDSHVGAMGCNSLSFHRPENFPFDTVRGHCTLLVLMSGFSISSVVSSLPFIRCKNERILPCASLRSTLEKPDATSRNNCAQACRPSVRLTLPFWSFTRLHNERQNKCQGKLWKIYPRRNVNGCVLRA